MVQALLINGKQECPCDISEAIHIVVTLAKSGDYFSIDIAKPADEIAMKQIVDSVYWACKDKYHLEIDNVGHVMHLVSDVFPLIKESRLSQFKAQEKQEQQPLETISSSNGKKLYTNKQVSRIEFEKNAWTSRMSY